MDANKERHLYDAVLSGVERAENHRNAKKSRKASVAAAAAAAAASIQQQQQRIKLHVNFDHLSIVSEEETSITGCGGGGGLGHSDSLDGDDEDDDHRQRCTHTVEAQSDQMSSSTLIDFQSIVPSLAHFENLCYEKIGPNLGKFARVLNSRLGFDFIVLYLRRCQWTGVVSTKQ